MGPGEREQLYDQLSFLQFSGELISVKIFMFLALLVHRTSFCEEWGHMTTISVYVEYLC